jgi:hypothetical protein
MALLDQLSNYQLFDEYQIFKEGRACPTVWKKNEQVDIRKLRVTLC